MPKYMTEQKTAFNHVFFCANRKRLRGMLPDDVQLVILTGNGRMQQTGTESYAFHQDRNFWYLTGIDEPEVILVMDGTDEYLILPDRGAVQNVFDGSYEVDELKHISGVMRVYNQTEGWNVLRTRLRGENRIATAERPPVFIDVFSLYSNPARAHLIRRLRRAKPGLELLDIRKHIADMRTVKQPIELAALQQAVDITLDAIRAATLPEKLARYQYEYELEAEISYGMRRKGAETQSFPPIVASGPRACTLHYIANNHSIAKDATTVVDVGAVQQHYAADISRTVCVGNPTARQQAVVAAVEESVQHALSLLRSGVVIRDYEQNMEQFLGKQLRALGVITTNKSADIRRYFPHATSHYLGLDAHDAGDYLRPLEPGAVITVEPGIYIPEESIGVRLEEDVVITNNGVEVLSSGLGRALIYG